MASERSAKYRQEIQQIGVFNERLHFYLKMASSNKHGDHSSRSSHPKSKIVVLKVGDALRTLDPGSKVVMIKLPPEQLARISEHQPYFQALPKQPTLDSNGTGGDMAKPHNIRSLRSAISVSETGSPLPRRGGPSSIKSGQGQVNNVSRQRTETTSDFPTLSEHIYTNPLKSFSHEKKRAPPPLTQEVDPSPNSHSLPLSGRKERPSSRPLSWRKRQQQLMQQLGLFAEKRQQGSPPQVNQQIPDPKISSPTESAPLKDLARLLEVAYDSRPYSSPTNSTPSQQLAATNDERLLPATVSAALATDGRNQKLDSGVSGTSASALTKTNPEDFDFETPEEFRERLTCVLEQMMFVSGETAEASPETTGMIEEIVRAQVIEMLRQASELANRRGVRSISTADLIFLIRHDKAKVSRLKTFLSWKDVRKNVKDSDEKGGGDAGEVDFDDGANLPGAGPVDSKKSSNKKAKLILPWEVQSFYSEQVPERDDEEDNEEEEEQNEATLARLASADERTKNMTRDEYVYWSDCRQASFTFRKGKRFREWAGFGVVTDSKPNDDIVDILGFLTFEIVQTLTEEALKVKAAEDLHNARTTSAAGGETKKRKREGSSLFEMPEEGRTPVEPKHVREAFRRLQIMPKKYNFMRQGYAGIKNPLKLI